MGVAACGGDDSGERACAWGVGACDGEGAAVARRAAGDRGDGGGNIGGVGAAGDGVAAFVGSVAAHIKCIGAAGGHRESDGGGVDDLGVGAEVYPEEKTAAVAAGGYGSAVHDYGFRVSKPWRENSD